MLRRFLINHPVQLILGHCILARPKGLWLTRRRFQVSLPRLESNQLLGNTTSENVRMLMRRVTQPGTTMLAVNLIL